MSSEVKKDPHSPGSVPKTLSKASRFGGRGRGKGAMRPSVGGRGILNVGGRGLGDRATVKPQHKMSLKAKPPSTPQCKVSQKKDSPDSVIAPTASTAAPTAGWWRRWRQWARVVRDEGGAGGAGAA